MSINSHRRNFSTTHSNRLAHRIQQQSLRKINHSSNHHYFLLSAKQHYYKFQDMSSAIKDFESYLIYNPTHLQSLYLCAISYMQTGHYPKAIEKLMEYLSLRKTHKKMIFSTNLPSNANAFLLLAIAYKKINNLVRALEVVNQSLSIDERLEEGYCLRAKIYLKMGQSRKAYCDFLSALKCNNHCLAATLGLGDYYSNITGNYSVALKYYKRVCRWLEQPAPSSEKKVQISEMNEGCWEVLKESKQLGGEIKVKCAICLYQLESYEEAMQILTAMLSENHQTSELYYYLGMSQLKHHERTCNAGNSVKSSRDPQQAVSYASQDTLFQQALLNLQCSISVNTHRKIIQKSCKTLIKILVQNYQFYEAETIMLRASELKITIEEQKQLCEACMLVIKHKFGQALPALIRLYDKVSKGKEGSWDDQQQHESLRKPKISKEQVINSVRPEFNRNQGNPSKRQLLVVSPTQREQHRRQVQDMNPVKTFIENSEEDKLCNVEQKQDKLANLPVDNEFQWMKPILLLFRSYAEFFMNHFTECLEVFEVYESYIKDYLGKQPDSDIFLSYNKVLCEGILMMDSEMTEESIEKFCLATENYKKLLRSSPVQPVLFQVMTLLRLALSDQPYYNQQINSKTEIIIAVEEILSSSQAIIKNNSLIYYYHGLVLYSMSRYQEASEALQICLKYSDQCHWKYLYVKGVVELKNLAYKEAYKQFSAGLILEDKPELYLGRCISYMRLYEQMQKNPAFIQSSFQDLQKFIELETQKHEISNWVTKILFHNQAFEEAAKSMKKVPQQAVEADIQLQKIEQYLHIFEGQFEQSGVLGEILINALQGKYKQGILEVNDTFHHFSQTDFVSQSYHKWLNILNLYAEQKYVDLIKYLQTLAFEVQDHEEELIELKYNLFIVYVLVGQQKKASNLLSSLNEYECMKERVAKIEGGEFEKDECFPDLQWELGRGTKRLSRYLSYKKAMISSLDVHVKLSIPFPPFPKPSIQLELSEKFIIQETAQSCIPKKIEAPWIKKIIGTVQFTNHVVESTQTSILEPTETQDKEDKASLSQFQAGSIST